MEEEHNDFDLLKKTQPNPVHILGENTKPPPTGKFAAHVVTGAANSNNLTNSSYGKAASYEGRYEWSPRSYFDMRDMCSISKSIRMTCFKRHLSQ